MTAARRLAPRAGSPILSASSDDARTTVTARRRRVSVHAAVSVAVALGLTGTVLPSAVAAKPGTTTTAATTAATVQAVDAFDRTVTTGWGSASTGGAWTATGGDQYFSVGGGQGAMRADGAGWNLGTRLAGVAQTDTEVQVRTALDKMPTGSGTDLEVAGRVVTDKLSYRLRLKMLATGVVRASLLAVNGSTVTTLAQVNVPGLTYTAGAPLQVRLQVQGTSPTTLRTKVWAAAGTEPSAWTATATDSTAGLQAAGGLGLSTYTSSSATNLPQVASFAALWAGPVASAPVVTKPNTAPVSAFTAAASGLVVALDGSGSTDADGTVTAYSWDLGNGATASGRTLSYTYPAAGTYTVGLTVTDDRGATHRSTQPVTVVKPNTPPVSAFTATTSDLAVTLDGTQSSDPDGAVTAYAWDLGDGTSATTPTLTRSYTAAGTYTVALTVTDDRGATHRSTKTITTTRPNTAPVAAFTATKTDLSVAFDAGQSTDSDGTLTAYSWDLGDGTTATGRTAARTYAAPGTYTVALTVTDDRGATHRTTQQVTVALAAPAAPGAVKPDRSNTGFRAGGALTVHEGDLTITTPGTVIDHMDIRGFVTVKAANVTIKNSIIRGKATSVQRALVSSTMDTASVTIEDSELYASVPSGWVDGVRGWNITARRLNIHDVIDGFHIYGPNVRLESNYIHDHLHFEVDPAQNNTPSHDDSMQIQKGSNIRIIGNSFSGAYNTGIQLTQDQGVVSDVQILKNWGDGGGCTVNFAEKGRGPFQGMVVSDNTFGRTTKVYNCAIIAPTTTSSIMTAQRNYFTDGTTALVRKGS